MSSIIDVILKEQHPMYDFAVISPKGCEYWHNELSNNCNNSHSVTKFFIASAIGILCDRGEMSVDDKVVSFFNIDELPENYDEKWNEVTVKHALQHKTGICTIPYCVDCDDDIGYIGDDFLKYVFSLPIEQKTGEYRRYSDEAYYLLGRIVGKAAGEFAEEFLNKNIFLPLGFRQWAMAKCPMGYPICGGGFYARADDIAKLGYVYANDGMYNGKRIISEGWINRAMNEDFACTRFRESDVFVKTGAKGQMVAFSKKHKTACAWHGCSSDGNARNDRLLEAFVNYLNNNN